VRKQLLQEVTAEKERLRFESRKEFKGRRERRGRDEETKEAPKPGTLWDFLQVGVAVMHGLVLNVLAPIG
jgi:hypothetical protein